MTRGGQEDARFAFWADATATDGPVAGVLRKQGNGVHQLTIDASARQALIALAREHQAELATRSRWEAVIRLGGDTDVISTSVPTRNLAAACARALIDIDTQLATGHLVFTPGGEPARSVAEMYERVPDSVRSVMSRTARQVLMQGEFGSDTPIDGRIHDTLTALLADEIPPHSLNLSLWNACDTAASVAVSHHTLLVTARALAQPSSAETKLETTRLVTVTSAPVSADLDKASGLAPLSKPGEAGLTR